MPDHSESKHHRTTPRDRTPWNIAERNDDDLIIPVFRRFTKLRERLLLYLAQSARVLIEASAWETLRHVFAQ